MEEKKRIAIQECYGDRFQHCWGCGLQNQEGLHLHSYPSQDGEACLCRVKVPKQYTGGVPDKLFGGMIATIFDCHGTASAAWFNHHKKGLELTEDTVIGRYITARLEVDYLKPVPMDQEIQVRAKLEDLGERKAIIQMEMEVEGQVRARARMVAVGVKDNM